MIIYKATNKINGKCYVGQTRHSLEYRKRLHLSKARQGLDTHFYQAIRKYGEDNFEWEIICSAKDKQTLNELETFYITKYDSIKHGYNMVDGGDNNIMDVESVKNKHDEVMRSEEVRKKISDSMKKYRKEHPFTEEHRKKLSEKAMGNQHFLGHKHTDEFKRRMSEIRLNRNYESDENKINVCEKGRKKKYIRKSKTIKRVQEGRSIYDTRSIACYCVDECGKEHHFYSYLDAGKWWYENYRPFPYSTCTYQRKIQQSIKLGYATYRDMHKKTHFFYSPKWFVGGDYLFE